MKEIKGPYYLISKSRELGDVRFLVDPAARLEPGDVIFVPLVKGMYRTRRGKRSAKSLKNKGIVKHRVCEITVKARGPAFDVDAFIKKLSFWS